MRLRVIPVKVVMTLAARLRLKFCAMITSERCHKIRCNNSCCSSEIEIIEGGNASCPSIRVVINLAARLRLKQPLDLLALEIH